VLLPLTGLLLLLLLLVSCSSKWWHHTHVSSYTYCWYDLLLLLLVVVVQPWPDCQRKLSCLPIPSKPTLLHFHLLFELSMSPPA
jgi:hypothetical protein